MTRECGSETGGTPLSRRVRHLNNDSGSICVNVIGGINNISPVYSVSVVVRPRAALSHVVSDIYIMTADLSV
ncbi:hypothetical protein J6590_046854 [Homalodisca vitripennis]|nr:hypothetical protein J6590_046854 [Homalodisca vitripennis]